MASIVTALFAYSKGPAASAVERFNIIFSQVVDADVNQFFLFPQLALSTYRVDIGPFSIGPFAPARLAYMSRKAGSDFYDRYEENLRNIPFSVERKPRSVRLVYLHKMVGPNGQWISQSKSLVPTLTYLVDEYFAILSGLHFAEFFAELNTVQEVPMALGSGWFDLNKMREVLGFHQISVYLKIGGDTVGFVSPAAALVMGINLGGGHIGMPITEKYLYRNFGFVGFTDCEIHRSLQSFCHFLALAAQHRSAGRGSEAFLHNVIGLDLLLGEEGSSTNSVSTRSAALVFRAIIPKGISECKELDDSMTPDSSALGEMAHDAALKTTQDYSLVVKDLQRIYNARSKYVHEGKQPDSSLLPLAEKICREVAFCLFRLQRDEENRLSGFHKRWLKDIDFVIAAIEAGRLFVENDWQRTGVALGNDSYHADFLAELEYPTSPPN